MLIWPQACHPATRVIPTFILHITPPTTPNSPCFSSVTRRYHPISPSLSTLSHAPNGIARVQRGRSRPRFIQSPVLTRTRTRIGFDIRYIQYRSIWLFEPINLTSSLAHSISNISVSNYQFHGRIYTSLSTGTSSFPWLHTWQYWRVQRYGRSSGLGTRAGNGDISTGS